MSSLSLARKALRDGRRALIGWAVGTAVFVSIYISAWSQVKHQSASSGLNTIPSGLRDALGWTDTTTALGYLQATVYSVFVPLLLIMYATIIGNAAIAAQEENGALELVIAHPVSRRRLVLEHFAAMAVRVIAVGAVVWVLVLAYSSKLNMNVGVAGITAATLGLTLLSLCFGTMALAVGALVGRRAVVFAVTGGVAIGMYLINALSNTVSAIRPLHWISLFHYYLGDEPLRNGFDAGYLIVLAAVAMALATVATLGFERRDVAV